MDEWPEGGGGESLMGGGGGGESLMSGGEEDPPAITREEAIKQFRSKFADYLATHEELDPDLVDSIWKALGGE
jgi:hypothetical protein